MSTGRTDRLMHLAVISLPVMAAALWVFSSRNIFEATVAYSVTLTVLQIATQHFALQSIGGVGLNPSATHVLCWEQPWCSGLILLQHQIAWMPGLARLVLLSVAGAVIYIAWTWFSTARHLPSCWAPFAQG